MPRSFEAAELSSEVYETGGGTPSAEWRIICTSDNFGLSKEGFFAAVYFNEQKKEVVISYRGTCLTEISNLVSDYNLWRQRMPKAQEIAEKFLIEVQKHHPTLSKITHVGHSLGGFHAIINAVKSNQQAIVFDTPSIKELLIDEVVALSLDPSLLSNSKDNIVTYLSAPNLINSGDQIGKIVQLELPSHVVDEINQLKEKLYIKYAVAGGIIGYLASQLVVTAHDNLRKHSILTIINALGKHEVAEFNKERDLAYNDFCKKNDKLFAPLRDSARAAAEKYSSVKRQREIDLDTLRSEQRNEEIEYDNDIKERWNKHWDYVSKHRREEKDFKEKYPRDKKGYDHLCKSNEEKEKKRADYITEEYGKVITHLLGGYRYQHGRRYSEIAEKYTKEREALVEQYNVFIEKEKINSEQLRQVYDETYGKALAEFREEWGSGGGCYDTNSDGEYINQGRHAQAIRNKYPQELKVMGIFAACMHTEGLSQNLFFFSNAQESGDDTDSENSKLEASVAQLNSIYESIVEKMQRAAGAYHKGEIDEEEYIKQSQDCKIDDEQFISISENIETNELLTEEFKATLRYQKNIVRSRHDLVFKDIIVNKLDRIKLYVSESDKNRGSLLLLFNEIEQRWSSIERKDVHSHLMLKKAELAFQLEEFGIAAQSYTAVLHLINDDEKLLEQSQVLIDQLQVLISLCEQLRDAGEINADLRALYEKILNKRDIVSEIEDKLVRKKEEYRTTLENLSFIQLGIDLAIKLFEKYERQKAQNTPEEALAEPYLDVIHSASAVTNQIVGVTKHQIGETLRQLDNPTFEMIKELLGDMTPEEDKLVRDLFKPEPDSEIAKANYRNFFEQNGGKFLYFKRVLSASLCDTGLAMN